MGSSKSVKLSNIPIMLTLCLLLFTSFSIGNSRFRRAVGTSSLREKNKKIPSWDQCFLENKHCVQVGHLNYVPFSRLIQHCFLGSVVHRDVLKKLNIVEKMV